MMRLVANPKLGTKDQAPMDRPGFAVGRIRVVLFGGGQTLRSLNDSEDLEIVRCDEASRLRTVCKSLAPSVVLVDLALLRERGETGFLKGIRRLNALPVALSDTSDDATCEGLLRAGFAGLLQLDASVGTVARAVRSVAEGQLWFPRGTISRLLRGFLMEEGLNRLTSRELEILALIGSGLNNQQIADKLFICRETVRWHVRGIYSRLGIEDPRSAREYLRSLGRLGKPADVQPHLPAETRRSLVAS